MSSQKSNLPQSFVYRNREHLLTDKSRPAEAFDRLQSFCSLTHLRIDDGWIIQASRISMAVELPNWWERQKSFIYLISLFFSQHWVVIVKSLFLKLSVACQHKIMQWLQKWHLLIMKHSESIHSTGKSYVHISHMFHEYQLIEFNTYFSKRNILAFILKLWSDLIFLIGGFNEFQIQWLPHSANLIPVDFFWGQ